MKVVCLKEGCWYNLLGQKVSGSHPIKGEIYVVEGSCQEFGRIYFFLQGFSDMGYNSNSFREVDNTFGHVVCETIEQQIELEKVMT